MQNLWNSLKDNLFCVLICLLISALVFGLALLCEKLSPAEEKSSASPLRRITVTALSSALAAVLMLLDFPLFFAPSFYKLDFSELPILICGFALGPVAGVTAEFIKVLLKVMIKGTATAFVGEFSNFVLGCSFILPAAALYRRHKTKKRAALGLTLGTLVMTVFGSFFNAYYLIPQYSRLFGLSVEALVSAGTAINPYINSVSTLVLLAVVPFNLLKGLLVSLLTMLLYKYIKKILIGS